mmetsp:Transcript_3780/g.2257  ORF Transcript_3780/g.2257 Transcript_3780/m.2257 type:complete len:94 (-) Transcript_3780:47-328(-)
MSTQYGNACASASLMFCLIGKVVDLIFEEEIKDYGVFARNIVVGALTGGIYKSALGAKPIIVGSVIGGGLIAGLTYSVNSLNDYGIIGFRMEI